jgi:hypothetical protein
MTEEKKTEETKPVDPAAGVSIGGLGVGTIISAVLGLIGGALGAGVPGIIALGVVGLVIGIGGPVAWNAILAMVNGKIDKSDHDNSGADAGKTAVDLQNQAREATRSLDEAQRLDPPTEGFPKAP